MRWQVLEGIPEHDVQQLLAIGRRRVFLGSVLGMSLATVLAAFSPNAFVFVGLQMVGRMFMVTTAATSFVIVTEELGARNRGWGIGIIQEAAGLRR